MKIGLAFLDFGGPQGPDELEGFLTNLLSDVLPVPGPLRGPVARRVATRRAKLVGPQYAEIGWSPLVPTHRAQAAAVVASLGEVVWSSGMMYTPPTMDDCVRDLLEQGADAFVALPFFPHYSLATTHSAFTMFHEALERAGRSRAPVHWIGGYYDHPLYVRAVADTIREAGEGLSGEGPIHLVFTPHGLPVSFVRKGDPYPEQIRASARRIVESLGWSDPWHIGWQSRVGPVRWLSPSTPELLHDLATSGVRRAIVVPISFASEHIETLYEIDVEILGEAREAGLEHVARAAVVGLQPSFIACLVSLARRGLQAARPQCVRCLVPQALAERKRAVCPNCDWKTPAFLSTTVPLPGSGD